MAITQIRLLKVDFTKDYSHTLFFATKEDQEYYFLHINPQIYGRSDFSYQRKEGFVRYPAHIDELNGCNYLMYRNTETSDKWYYAFITDLVYRDEGRTDIYFELDVIQTYMFDIEIRPSFVEREHVIPADDIPGNYTFPEQLELGDYIVTRKNRYLEFNSYSAIIGATVDLTDDEFPSVSGTIYNKIYSGVRYYRYHVGSEYPLNTVLKKLADAGKSDAIVSIFMFPDKLLPDIEGLLPQSYQPQEVDWEPVLNGSHYNFKPTSIDGYYPRNKKLLTYPYTYMLMSNNSGGSAVYKYELFSNDLTAPDTLDEYQTEKTVCKFKIKGALTPGGSIILIPFGYNYLYENYQESLPLGKYPICSWNNDIYTNWLTQNSINIGISLAGSVVQIASGVIASGTGAGALAGGAMIGSGITGVASSIGEIYQHSLTPPQAEGNVNSGDVMFSSGNLTFTAYTMSVKKEYAQIIDEYFSMFGYKINRVKIPNSNHRASYWYTKTIDANIVGDIPADALKKIKDCYNRGITFWRRNVEMYNYNIGNGEPVQ